MSPTEKAAILLVSLGEELAGQILQMLPKTDAQRILTACSRLKKVDEHTVSKIQAEFHALLQTQIKSTTGGIDAARKLILKAFGANDSLLQDFQGSDLQSFKDAEYVEAKILFQILEKEVPQTIAVILLHLSPKKSGEVLSLFSAPRYTEIMIRMASIQEIEPSILEDIDAEFGKAINRVRNQSGSKIGGIDKTAAVFASMSATQREAMLNQLEETQPEMAAQIRAKLWTFEDLKKFTAADIEKLLRKVSAQDLQLALRKTSPELQAKIFSAMSENRSKQLKDDIAVAKPAAIEKVEEAQRKIATLAVEMIKNSELNDPNAVLV